MSNNVDQDQQWLIDCLSATLDPRQDVRSFAELSISQASLQAGFGCALARIAANRDFPAELRQFAAVLLKQFVRKHWQEDEDTFEYPISPSDEKATIRGLLLKSLDDSHSKICTAISMAVTAIAQYDWPEDWPDLLPFLIKLIGHQVNMNAVHGALRCLDIMCGDLDDKLTPRIIPAVFPSLYAIVSSPKIYDKYARVKALSIVYSCTSMVAVLRGVYKKETDELMLPMLNPWMEQFSIILEPPVKSEDPEDWSIRMEAVKCLNQIAQSFPRLNESDFLRVTDSFWRTFVSCLQVYEMSSVNGIEDSYEGRYDSCGAERSLESLVVQLFEFLSTLVGNAKLCKILVSNLCELIYYTIGYLQITEEQVHTWSRDANQYIFDEDQMTCSSRSSGALLLEGLVLSFGREVFDAVTNAVEKRLLQSNQENSLGAPASWKMLESILFTLESLSDQLLEKVFFAREMPKLRILLEHVVSRQFGIEIQEYPFLLSRLFSTVGKFSSVVDGDTRNEILTKAMKAVSSELPFPVKVGACRALSQLSTKEFLRPNLVTLFSCLTDLLGQVTEQALHLVLETLRAVVRAGDEDDVVQSIEHILSPIVLNTWASHVSDPFITIDVLEVLNAIKCCPGCVRPLVARVLHVVGPVLNKATQQPKPEQKQHPDDLVAGSLDLLTMLMKNSEAETVKSVYDVCFTSVVRMVLTSTDHSEIQNATECLAVLVLYGRHGLLSWDGGSGFSMKCLLDVASRLLDPSLDSSSSLLVGNYILQLILHFPSEMVHHTRDLIVALVTRMRSAETPQLKYSLLLILARLVHLSTPDLSRFIELLLSIPVRGESHNNNDNALAYLMLEWTGLQSEIHGSYPIKVSTTALALLLFSRNPELARLTVPGHLVAKTSTMGILTRTKARLIPDQWTYVPLPQKLMALLADVMIEFEEQVGDDDDDDDSEWDECEEDCGYMKTLDSQQGLVDVDAQDSESGGDEDDDPLSSADPLNEVNLKKYLVDFFNEFYERDRAYADSLLRSLTKRQSGAVLGVIRQKP